MLSAIGDVAQFANPIAAFVITENKKQYLTEHLETILMVGIGKELGKRTKFDGSKRPDGTSFKGMPSGHTASAWVSASHTRHPILYGTAVVTAYSRIHAKKHTAPQVLAGVLLGELVVLVNSNDVNISVCDYGINIRVRF